MTPIFTEKNIYLLVRIVTNDSKLRAFQFKLLNNVPQNNSNYEKMIFKFGKIGSPQYFFRNLKDETVYHLFYNCSHTNYFCKAGLKKLFVCRHPSDPALEVPTQNILLDL